MCITEKIPCPNPYPREKYTDIRSMEQKQTKALRHLEFVNFRVEIWEQSWGPVLESSGMFPLYTVIPLYTIIDVWVF